MLANGLFVCSHFIVISKSNFISVRKKSLIMHNYHDSVICYDVKKDKWSEQTYELTERTCEKT